MYLPPSLLYLTYLLIIRSKTLGFNPIYTALNDIICVCKKHNDIDTYSAPLPHTRSNNVFEEWNAIVALPMGSTVGRFVQDSCLL